MYHRAPVYRRSKLRSFRRRRPSRLWKVVKVLLTAGVVAAVGFVATVWWTARPAVAETVPLRSGTVDEMQPIDAWVVRGETIYRATAAGPVTRLVAEGERVRANTPVVSLGGAQVIAQNAGVISYQFDGLEDSLTPANAAKWEIASIRAFTMPPGQKAPEGTVAAQSPLFKLVDNLQASLVTVVPLSGYIGFETGGKVRVRLGGPDSRTVTATVLRQVQSDQEQMLYLSVPDLAADLVAVRRVQATLIGRSVQGLIAPRSAIDVRNGLQGVWVADGKQDYFEPVVVLGGNEQEVAMEADLKPGTKIRRSYPLRMP
ncbi:MAG: HlyD family efflux transporter periplasmic adaptor subunit [Mycobacterium leprae]